MSLPPVCKCKVNLPCVCVCVRVCVLRAHVCVCVCVLHAHVCMGVWVMGILFKVGRPLARRLLFKAPTNKNSTRQINENAS